MRSSPVCSRFGMVTRQPRSRSRYSRYPVTSRSARHASSFWLYFAPGLRAKSAMVRPSSSVTRWATISSVRPPADFSSARYRAPRSWVTWTKSLKCPACSEASCRLSTNASSLRALSSRSPSQVRRARTMLAVISDIAELRPSADSLASLAKSLPRACS